jgi:hypothetical protein
MSSDRKKSTLHTTRMKGSGMCSKCYRMSFVAEDGEKHRYASRMYCHVFERMASAACRKCPGPVLQRYKDEELGRMVDNWRKCWIGTTQGKRWGTSCR